MAGSSRLDDDLGLDYGSPERARADAIRAAREIIADILRHNEQVPVDGAIEITDERGRLIESVPLVEAAFGAVPENRYRRIFDGAPQCYLLLTPDFTIVEANRAYLRATMTSLAAIAHRPLFDIFPDNPGDPGANGVRNLSASLQTVLRDKAEGVMPVQRYDIRRPDGGWDMRYWKATNTPLIDAGGGVEFILHHAEDVTAIIAREPSQAR